MNHNPKYLLKNNLTTIPNTILKYQKRKEPIEFHKIFVLAIPKLSFQFSTRTLLIDALNFQAVLWKKNLEKLKKISLRMATAAFNNSGNMAKSIYQHE
jgi:hypothetical protein